MQCDTFGVHTCTARGIILARQYAILATHRSIRHCGWTARQIVWIQPRWYLFHKYGDERRLVFAPPRRWNSPHGGQAADGRRLIPVWSAPDPTLPRQRQPCAHGLYCLGAYAEPSDGPAPRRAVTWEPAPSPKSATGARCAEWARWASVSRDDFRFWRAR